MKYGVLLLIGMLLWWQWRHGREVRSSQATRKKAAQAQLVDMVACANCGLHLPASEAVTGALGVYCSPAHRHAREP
jgi:uncharacterized protein